PRRRDPPLLHLPRGLNMERLLEQKGSWPPGPPGLYRGRSFPCRGLRGGASRSLLSHFLLPRGRDSYSPLCPPWQAFLVCEDHAKSRSCSGKDRFRRHREGKEKLTFASSPVQDGRVC